jgi:hypothetical protein
MLAQIAGSTYDNSYVAADFDILWEDAYAEVLIDAATLVPLAQQTGFWAHSGVARFFSAYTYVTLVDFYGDVPFSEALDPGNFNPVADDDADVYAGALVLLDSAIADFQKPNPATFDDFFYDNNLENWIKACNTLKLKIYLNQRLVDPAGSTAAINNLISEGNLILSADGSEDLVFVFSDNSINPDNRHPKYINSYNGGTTGGEYMANYYMTLFLSDVDDAFGNPIEDPRTRYYFYRQSTVTPDDPTIVDCFNVSPPVWYRPFDPYCFASVDGYWGRDHVDNDGIPPDNQLRTTWGFYPAGGLVDADQ